MKISRLLLSTCLGTVAVCCVLYPLWSSRNPASPRGFRVNGAGLTTGDLKNVSLPSKLAATAGNQTPAFQAFAQQPLSFERNVGQSAPNIQFVSRGPGYSLALSSKEAVLSLSTGDKRKGLVGHDAPIVTTTALRMSLVGANQKAAITGLGPLPDKVNYLIGNDPKQWKLHVPHYARVKYEGVYPGIDLVYYGNQRKLEYDFVVAPGADPSQIRLSFDGAKSLRLDPATGDLVITTADGDELRHKRPVIYQMDDSQKATIAGSYRLLDQKQATFALATYDPRKSLVIDPTLDFTQTFGGSLGDAALGIAVDDSGNAYVTGYTFSSDFPQFGAQGPYFCTTAGVSCTFTFVIKLLPSGEPQFSTFIGGENVTLPDGIAADSTGAFITGITSSTNFLTNAKYALGTNNAFVAHLDTIGEYLDWVVGLGGPDITCQNAGGTQVPCVTNVGLAIAVDAKHAAYIAGYTTSLGLPTTEKFKGAHKAWQPASGCSPSGGVTYLGFPCQDGYVAKVPPDGNFDDGGYSTYIGGSVFDRIQGIAVDGTGHASVTGETYSPDFPALTSNAGLAPEGSGYTAFVTRLVPDGSAAVYSYFLGGHEDLANGDGPPEDSGNAIAVDFAGQAYVTGATCDLNFPTTPGAYQRQEPNCVTLSIDTSFNFAGFVSVFSPLGELMYSTTFAGLGPVPAPGQISIVQTVASSIAIDPRGEIFVGGYTDADFVFFTPNPGAGSGNNVGFVAKLAPDLSQAMWVNFAGVQVTGVAVQPPCPGIRCIIESRLYTEVYATGDTFLPGADVNNPNNVKVFVSKWTDSDVVVTPGPPRLYQ